MIFIRSPYFSPLVDYQPRNNTGKLEMELQKMQKKCHRQKPVTFPKSLFSSENISSEGFRIGLLIPMPFEALVDT